MELVFKPAHSREELEKYFTENMYKKPYDRFSWWRMYIPKNKPLHKRNTLLERIENGDLDFSHYKLQAEYVEHNINDIYQQHYPDIARYMEEASIHLSRRKRLMEDHWKEEDNRLEVIKKDFVIYFKITQEKLENEMIEFGGSLKDFYYHIKEKYGLYRP